MPASKIHVVVYGTLRKGERAHRMMKDATFVNVVQLYGSMYNMGSYPGIRLDQPGNFVGELYEVAPAVLPALDGYEGCSSDNDERGLYTRKTVNIQGVDAYIYEINHGYDRAARIDSGDWLKRHG